MTTRPKKEVSRIFLYDRHLPPDPTDRTPGSWQARAPASDVRIDA